MIRTKNISTALLVFFSTFFIWKPLKAQIEFVENKGQWDKRVLYKGEFSSGNFFLEKKGFTVKLNNVDDLAALSKWGHGLMSSSITVHSFVYKVKFLGSAEEIKSEPEKALASYNNYFLGNDPSKWAGNCKIFQAITYRNVYPNIDVRYYSDGTNMKYDFIVHPGGNPSEIAMQYDGPELSLKDKQLIIKTSVAEIKELSPYSYQKLPKGQQEVDCRYVLKNNVVRFDVRKYDPNETLIIDPILIFSSYTGSRAENWGFTATPAPDGSLFAGGISFVDADFPVSPGALQTTHGGGIFEDHWDGYDIAIFKFSSNGSNRVYATYLGGSRNEQPHSMISDAAGNLIITGRSNSTNFPVTVPAIGNGTVSNGTYVDYDIIITKINAAGNALLGSVRIGGDSDDGVNIEPKYRNQGAKTIRRNYGDDSRSEVILDNGNNVIVVGCTQSGNFPVRGNSLNGSSGYGGGGQDGIVLKFNSNFSVYSYGSYFGGSGKDGCFVAALNPANGIFYIAGGTTSNNLPGDRNNVINGNYKGGEADGFVAEIQGDAIVKTTYIGTDGADIVFGLKLDRHGVPYIMGTTGRDPFTPPDSPPPYSGWTIINAIYSNGGDGGQFIAKLEPNLSAYIYSTCFGTGGSEPNISPIAFLVDRCENVYVSGWGGGLNNAYDYNDGNTTGLPEVNALTGIPGPDGADFYFFVLKKNAASMLFGSHFGQHGELGDHVDGGTSRFDDNGVIYQAVCGCSGNDNIMLPTTPSAWSRRRESGNCNEAALKIKMDFAGVGAGLQPEIDGVKYDTMGCAPLNVIFRDTLLLGLTYYWDFGDGVRDTVTGGDVSHIYNDVGIYQVMLISEDPSTCNVRDTAYINIRVGNNRAALNFNAIKDTPCTSTTYTFNNLSTATFPTPAFQPYMFTWDFGDGSPVVTDLNPRHTFPSPGVYHITLTLNDTGFCNAPVVLERDLRVFPLVVAAFQTPQLGCAPYNANFLFTGGEAGTDFFWSFGDGTFSTDSTIANPTHLYANPGVYPVQLIVRDTNTCNKIDTSAYFNITVLPKPVAAFTWAPNPPQSNTPTQFTNLSTGAVRYLWDFGEEGETSTEVNPKHQFNSTGNFTVTLTAYTQNNCASSVTVTVNAIVDPLLDVPNAFTPGKFGENGYVMVRGYGIGKMDWKIYNRWGQMIYHTNSRKSYWDGTYKGKLQPMDVYAYTLDVIFTDGKKLRKTGDITLIR